MNFKDETQVQRNVVLIELLLVLESLVPGPQGYASYFFTLKCN